MTANDAAAKQLDAPRCAHRRVAYVKIHHANGTCSDSWGCSACGHPFVPAALRAPALRALVCPACGGSGVIRQGPVDGLCQRCAGTGVEPHRHIEASLASAEAAVRELVEAARATALRVPETVRAIAEDIRAEADGQDRQLPCEPWGGLIILADWILSQLAPAREPEAQGEPAKGRDGEEGTAWRDDGEGAARHHQASPTQGEPVRDEIEKHLQDIEAHAADIRALGKERDEAEKLLLRCLPWLTETGRADVEREIVEILDRAGLLPVEGRR